MSVVKHAHIQTKKVEKLAELGSDDSVGQLWAVVTFGYLPGFQYHRLQPLSKEEVYLICSSAPQCLPLQVCLLPCLPVSMQGLKLIAKRSAILYTCHKKISAVARLRRFCRRPQRHSLGIKSSSGWALHMQLMHIMAMPCKEPGSAQGNLTGNFSICFQLQFKVSVAMPWRQPGPF